MALFEVLDPHAGPDPPGPWETRPAPAASFGAGPEAPVWRVSLSGDPAAAHGALAAAEGDLRRQELAVATVPDRLRALVARGGAASFGRGADPEARLIALLNAPAGGGASFSTSTGEATAELTAAEERFQAFMHQVQDAVTNYAVVETRLEQALIARSTVNWTGDMRSLLGVGLGGEREALHRRSLGLTMRSRAALLHTFATVLRGATIVVVMASSPVGAARALPAAWRFVDDLLREARHAAGD